MSSIKSFKPKSIVITSLPYANGDGNRYDITSICPLFQYYEDIDVPFVRASLTVIDSGINLIGNLPIQGGELVEIEFDCGFSDNNSTVKQEPIKYKFRLWKIYNRIFDSKIQTYNIALTSEEAFVNEYQRVVKLLEGKPSKIVEDLLKNYLKTEENIDIEETGNQVSFYPARRSIASVIGSLQIRSMSSVAYDNSRKKKSNNTTTKVENENSENDPIVKGTAGYLFFQNRKGFNFKSMDKLCDSGKNFNGNAPIATYYSKNVKDTGDINNFFIVESYRFTSEIDIVDKFRRGVYSTKMIFYNLSTGKYDEFVYSLEDTFENMAKLGNQDNLPSFVTKNTDGKQLPPTRVISMVVDHETWHKEEGVADPEVSGENNQSGNTTYPDESKYLIMAGSSRRNTLDLQKLEITIPGNAGLTIGEKIKIYLPNMSTESERRKNPWDPQTSGNYLISKINHSFLMANERGPEFVTNMELIRDTYGMEEVPSNVK